MLETEWGEKEVPLRYSLNTRDARSVKVGTILHRGN